MHPTLGWMQYINGGGHPLIMNIVPILNWNENQGHSRNHMVLQSKNVKDAYHIYV